MNDRFKFTEKERDKESAVGSIVGYDYFGTRYYDSELGRSLSVDPLAEKYPGWSPYNYTLNNPLNIIDLDGLDVYSVQIFTVIGGAKLGGGISFSWVWDDQGYSGLLTTLGGGRVGGKILKYGVGATRYNTKSIFDLEGIGYSLGIGIGISNFAWSTETSGSITGSYQSDFNLSLGRGVGLAAWALFTYSTLLVSGLTSDFSKVYEHIKKGGEIGYDWEKNQVVLLDKDGKVIKKINLTVEQRKEQKEDKFLEDFKSFPDNSRVAPNELFDYDASKN